MIKGEGIWRLRANIFPGMTNCCHLNIIGVCILCFAIYVMKNGINLQKGVDSFAFLILRILPVVFVQVSKNENTVLQSLINCISTC